MELKNYQKEVIKDLVRYLDLLKETGSMSEAYKMLWEEKGVKVGLGVESLPLYKSTLAGVPQVCFKVPTGGGKTYLAANSIKPIFDAIPVQRAKAVVWLVPSDAILIQTYKSLSTVNHPYRQKIDIDFANSVEVYSKAQLLNGQNFSPVSVAEQLSIFVLSYDSFRTNKKEGRKAYQENGSLAPFAKYLNDKSALLDGTDETALIQVIRSLNPVVIVDESHHATSPLSKDMLSNFNPSFVLELTATPKKDSNIISFVDALKLKKENMVKLPVIVYNRKSQTDVFSDAISIRDKLEYQAIQDEQNGGRYIRPIVLLQSQPKSKDDSTTYEKIKNILIESDIPENQIAIKTADRDEIKNIDLMSRDCPIRYIITVDALKEGWDCPFAYVLATVANRTSSVAVEQILGRILRLPYTKKNANDVLNLSYVITSSNDFNTTLKNVVKGLNNAGFSSRDCRAKVDENPNFNVQDGEQTTFEPSSQKSEEKQEDNIPFVDTDYIKSGKFNFNNPSNGNLSVENDELFGPALKENEQYESDFTEHSNSDISNAPTDVRKYMNYFGIQEEFKDEIKKLELPQFVLKVGSNLFSEEEYVVLEKSHLSEGFTLKNKDCKIDFNNSDVEISRVDVQENDAMTPKILGMDNTQTTFFKKYFESTAPEKRLKLCKDIIKKKISKSNEINDKELTEYINRVVETLTEDQLSELEKSPNIYADLIKQKIESLLAEHKKGTFKKWLESNKIKCIPKYKLASQISPTTYTNMYPKSLYTYEEDNMNNFEIKMIGKLSSSPNIKWWHRNISRKGFPINGYVTAFPDIIAMTNSGLVLMIETKGDQLENSESREKSEIGYEWDRSSGNNFKYFMVYQMKSPGYNGSYSYDEFIDILENFQ